MGRRKKDVYTIDMFDEYEPPEVKVVVSEQKIMANSLRGEISKTIALVLNESPMDRVEIAQKMSDYLREDVSPNILNNYASPSQEHNISFYRLWALVYVTSDPRPLASLLGKIGYAIIDEKLTGAVEEALIEARLEDLQARKKTARLKWKR
ncbi:MAG: hypothetical protein HRU28_11700 [Rhizobiales bacterium]|nr:hypothetical protein [Hyphomicrobiales bacterium]